ncbi:hypothetical protein H4R33_000560 [Dimargaris cristalligena]|nr:hypothetical protein H4R33_000560 [Dimargaris cristalligena]
MVVSGLPADFNHPRPEHDSSLRGAGENQGRFPPSVVPWFKMNTDQQIDSCLVDSLALTTADSEVFYRYCVGCDLPPTMLSRYNSILPPFTGPGTYPRNVNPTDVNPLTTCQARQKFIQAIHLHKETLGFSLKEQDINTLAQKYVRLGPHPLVAVPTVSPTASRYLAIIYHDHEKHKVQSSVVFDYMMGDCAVFEQRVEIAKMYQQYQFVLVDTARGQPISTSNTN